MRVPAAYAVRYEILMLAVGAEPWHEDALLDFRLRLYFTNFGSNVGSYLLVNAVLRLVVVVLTHVGLISYYCSCDQLQLTLCQLYCTSILIADRIEQ